MVHSSALLALLASIAAAQTAPAPSRQFEAASVKVNSSGEPGGSMKTTPGGRFTATNSTLQTLLRYAYNVKDFQIVAPAWFQSQRYDINGVANGPATTPELRMMVQKLLTERFQLTVRKETREVPVYALVQGRTLRMKESSPGDTSVASGTGEITGERMTMTMLANQLANAVGRAVVNRTELTGKYDVRLRWTPDESAPAESGLDAPPSLYSAIQEQLGLKLEAQKGPVDVMVFDAGTKVPAEN